MLLLLPDDLLLHCLHRLRFEALARLYWTSKRLRRVACGNAVWRSVCMSYTPRDLLGPKSSWRFKTIEELWASTPVDLHWRERLRHALIRDADVRRSILQHKVVDAEAGHARDAEGLEGIEASLASIEASLARRPQPQLHEMLAEARRSQQAIQERVAGKALKLEALKADLTAAERARAALAPRAPRLSTSRRPGASRPGHKPVWPV